MKILLVGASGFLGQNVYEQLNQNYAFRILVKSKKNYFGTNPQYLYHNIDELEKEKIEIIINCAVNYGREKVSDLIESNILLPTKLLDMFEKTIKLYISFDSFYTKFEKNPLIKYSNSKNQVREWYKCYNNVKILNIRLEHVYGKYDSKKKFVPWLIDCMLKNKIIKLSECTQKRDFIHVDEIIKLLNELIKKEAKFSNGITNIEVGTGKSIEIKNFVLTLLKITKSNSKIIFGDKKFKDEIEDSFSDISTIPEFINWIPETSIEIGMKKTLNK